MDIPISNNPQRNAVIVGLISFGVGLAVGYFIPKPRKEVYKIIHGVDEVKLDPGDEIVEIRDPKANISNPSPLVITQDQYEAIVRNEKEFKETNDTTRIDYSQFGSNGAPGDIPDIEIDSEFTKVEIYREEEDEDTVSVETIEEHLERHTVFAKSDEEWDYEKEKQARTSSRPYIIHRDEFFEDSEDFNFAQVSCTYYEGDDILANNFDNETIFNYPQIVGQLRFGHGSGDPNVVYIRNEKRRAEYEIIRDSGLFSQEVLGLEIENNDRATKPNVKIPKFQKE